LRTVDGKKRLVIVAGSMEMGVRMNFQKRMRTT